MQADSADLTSTQPTGNCDLPLATCHLPPATCPLPLFPLPRCLALIIVALMYY